MVRRIPLLYFYLVPGIFFAALGAFDIGTDLLHHKLTLGNFLFNVVLFLPLLVRKAIVFKVFGIIAALFSAYAALAIIAWLGKYLNGAQFHSVFDTFVVGPIFVLFIFLMSASLYFAGNKMNRNKRAISSIE